MLLLLSLSGGVNLFRHVLCKQDSVSPFNFKSSNYLTSNIIESREKITKGEGRCRTRPNVFNGNSRVNFDLFEKLSFTLSFVN